MKPGQKVTTEHGTGEITAIDLTDPKPYRVKLDTPVYGYSHAYYGLNEVQKLELIEA